MTPDADPGSLDMNGIAECFRSSIPTDNDIRRARQRFLRLDLGARRSPSRVLVLALVQGFVIGITTLATAAFVGKRIVDHESPPAHLEANSVPVRTAPKTARRVPLEAPAEVAVVAESPERVALEGSKRPSPPTLRVEATIPRVEQLQPLPNLAASEHASTDAEPSGMGRRDGPWAAVAAALERGDRAGADSALQALSSSADGMTRDAAELTRAQIWIAAGKGESFRHTLLRLSESGHTPLIRRRASELLARLGRSTN